MVERILDEERRFSLDRCLEGKGAQKKAKLLASLINARHFQNYVGMVVCVVDYLPNILSNEEIGPHGINPTNIITSSIIMFIS